MSMRRAPRAAPRCPRRHSSIAVLALAFAAGCAAPGHRTPRVQAHHPHPTWGQTAREHLLQAEWRGKSYDSLVESLGVPARKMLIPGRDPALTWAVYYGVRDARAGCVDAFTIMVVDGEERIVDYFCR